MELSVHDKYKNVKALKLCINCLRTGHFVDSCKFGKVSKVQGKAQHITAQ